MLGFLSIFARLLYPLFVLIPRWVRRWNIIFPFFASASSVLEAIKRCVYKTVMWASYPSSREVSKKLAGVSDRAIRRTVASTRKASAVSLCTAVAKHAVFGKRCVLLAYISWCIIRVCFPKTGLKSNVRGWGTTNRVAKLTVSLHVNVLPNTSCLNTKEPLPWTNILKSGDCYHFIELKISFLEYWNDDAYCNKTCHQKSNPVM